MTKVKEFGAVVLLAALFALFVAALALAEEPAATPAVPARMVEATPRLLVEWDRGCRAGWRQGGELGSFGIECPAGKTFRVLEGKEFIPGTRSTGNAELRVREMDCSVQTGAPGETVVVCRGLEAEEPPPDPPGGGE